MRKIEINDIIRGYAQDYASKVKTKVSIQPLFLRFER